MADVVGDVVGAALASVPPELVSRSLKGGTDHVLMRDRAELAASFAQNDRVSLGKIRSDAIINPVASVIWFDDFGTSVTMDVGTTASENALVAAQDVAAAAGSCLLFKSVNIDKYFKPLWEVLGLTSDPGEPIELFAKFEGGNPDAGSLSWQIIGTPF
jgi:hypothetical protein